MGSAVNFPGGGLIALSWLCHVCSATLEEAMPKPTEAEQRYEAARGGPEFRSINLTARLSVRV
jgi:hypothetical protein